jgi:hypothetical protein
MKPPSLTTSKSAEGLSLGGRRGCAAGVILERVHQSCRGIKAIDPTAISREQTQVDLTLRWRIGEVVPLEPLSAFQKLQLPRSRSKLVLALVLTP